MHGTMRVALFLSKRTIGERSNPEGMSCSTPILSHLFFISPSLAFQQVRYIFGYP